MMRKISRPATIGLGRLARSAKIADEFKDIAPIDSAEAAGILTAYLQRIVDQGLANTADQTDKSNRLTAQIALVNKIIQLICQVTGNDKLTGEFVEPSGEQLLALLPPELAPEPVLKAARSTVARRVASALFR